MTATAYPGLTELATHLRVVLETKKFILLYAYNGTGKTRLSTEFKDLGKDGDSRDTLYFNAFTEDLFSWHNDLDGDEERYLVINRDSHFFDGLDQMEMDNRIRPLLNRYADFLFIIDTEDWVVRFSREVKVGDTTQTVENIKISRGEENIFIWCFFLAIVELALDDDGSGPYNWVRHVYIDDPVSSLDEHNAIAVASHLAQLLRREDSSLKTVISTHHTLFFNVLCNELKRSEKFFLGCGATPGTFQLRETGQTPFFHHVASMVELYEAERSGKLYTHHFSLLRAILEKTASFHGFSHFGDLIKQDPDDEDGILHTRMVNILSHGNYSLYEPQQMNPDNRRHFGNILHGLLERYPFNPALFPDAPEPATKP